MAADRYNIKDASPVLLEVMVCFVSQSCSLLKKYLRVLVNELKSMTEIISVLKDELKYDCHETASVAEQCVK